MMRVGVRFRIRLRSRVGIGVGFIVWITVMFKVRDGTIMVWVNFRG